MDRDRRVRAVLLVEGAANLAMMGAKAAVGFSTGSTVLLGDAIHSLADLVNNVLAWLAMRVASRPPDREHPYGHRKFETLAVFALGTLLAVLAVELAVRALLREEHEVVRHGWGLAVMGGVLATNVAITTFESIQARRLESDLLRADASHTFSDVLVTLAAIAGWQLAARGHTWLDPLLTLGVAGFVLYLAWGLFRRAVPVLVDESALDPEAVVSAVRQIPGIRGARGVRSRGAGPLARVEVVITVDGSLPTRRSHALADEVERTLRARFGTEDVTVHVEPDV